MNRFMIHIVQVSDISIYLTVVDLGELGVEDLMLYFFYIILIITD